MALNHKSSNNGHVDMPKRGHKVLPFDEKVKVLDFISKEKNDKLRLLRSMVRTNLLATKL